MAKGPANHVHTGQKRHAHQTGSTDDFHFIQQPLNNFPEKIHFLCLRVLVAKLLRLKSMLCKKWVDLDLKFIEGPPSRTKLL
jgi:hypothetical protein